MLTFRLLWKLTTMEVKEKVWRFNALCFCMESHDLLELNWEVLVKVQTQTERDIGI